MEKKGVSVIINKIHLTKYSHKQGFGIVIDCNLGYCNYHFQMECNHIHCKCNHNQRLLSRLHNIIYHAISCQRYGLVCKAKVNNQLIYPLTDCYHIYIWWWFVSLFVLRTWKDNVLKYCCNYKSYTQAVQISSCCFHTVKPKLVT